MTPGHHGSEDCVAKSKDGPREVLEVILLEVDFGIYFFFPWNSLQQADTMNADNLSYTL